MGPGLAAVEDYVVASAGRHHGHGRPETPGTQHRHLGARILTSRDSKYVNIFVKNSCTYVVLYFGADGIHVGPTMGYWELQGTAGF